MNPQIVNERTSGWWSCAWLSVLGIVLWFHAVSAQDLGGGSQRVASADSTRIVPLYYTEDVDAVMALVRGRGAETNANDEKLQGLAEHESALRAAVLPETARSGSQASASLTGDGCSVDQVQMGLAGKGRIHLRGPLEQVNAVARMLHEIDQPVGQVKVGIHVLQISASDDEAIDPLSGTSVLNGIPVGVSPAG